MKELTKEEFIQQLIDAGWSRDEAEQEYDDIQNDNEAGK
jgi:hypothetical protein